MMRAVTIAAASALLLTGAAIFTYMISTTPAAVEHPILATASSLFSDDYASARTKFLGLAKAASARIESYEHPEVGPTNETIYTDVAVLGNENAQAVVFVGSATHGVEGFAGSAIQIGLLREGYAGSLGQNVRLVLIHAINPYGFAHVRRANEDNVDLNRNFLEPDEPRPDNPGYDALADVLLPTSIGPMADLKALVRLLIHVTKNGYGDTRSAISSGQYNHADGLFYGGRSRAWSAETLATIVRRHGAGARRLAFIDVHTGLGPAGEAEIILNVQKDDPSYTRASDWWGEHVKTTKADESVSDDLSGTLKLAIPKMVPGVEVTAVGLEFGTVPLLPALRALRAENWLRQRGGIDHREADAIKLELLRAFYPDDDAWRSAVWAQGRDTIDKAIRGLLNSAETADHSVTGRVPPANHEPTSGWF
jgi:hypothetical protein